MRESQPAPQPTSRILSVGSICIRPSVGLAMGQWSCSIDSPLPASAQRLNSSRSAWSVSGFATNGPSPTRESRELQRAGAGRAEMRARSHRSASRAVARWAGKRINGPVFRSAGPNHRGNPSDYRPTKQEIQHENPREVPLLVPDNRRREIQQRDREYKHHRPPPSTLYYGSGRHFVPSVLQLLSPYSVMPHKRVCGPLRSLRLRDSPNHQCLPSNEFAGCGPSLRFRDFRKELGESLLPVLLVEPLVDFRDLRRVHRTEFRSAHGAEFRFLVKIIR